MERLPSENTVYLGDTARVPYGSKSAEVITRYSLKNAEFLLGHGVKLLVVACNTASAVALPAMAAQLKIPVLGVIEPGARAAAKVSRTGKIGIIGTQGTIRSRAYQQALAAAWPGAAVHTQACPLFVPLAEEGWLTGEVPRLVARGYLSALAKSGIDTLVLGCTHYPLLREVIAEVMGRQVTLIDSAQATAEAAAELLSQHALLAPTGHPEHQYYVTDVPERFAEVGTHFLGHHIAGAQQVDITF
jgi:glutamate racemase